MFPDVSANRSRDIYVQHLGTDPKTGWLAFDARKAGSASGTAFSNGSATDKCSSTAATVPRSAPTAPGLRQYPAVVNSNGKVIINFNASGPATTTIPRRPRRSR